MLQTTANIEIWRGPNPKKVIEGIHIEGKHFNLKTLFSAVSVYD